MVISAPDGWTVEDESIFEQIWGCESEVAMEQSTSLSTGAESMEVSSSAQIAQNLKLLDVNTTCLWLIITCLAVCLLT